MSWIHKVSKVAVAAGVLSLAAVEAPTAAQSASQPTAVRPARPVVAQGAPRPVRVQDVRAQILGGVQIGVVVRDVQDVDATGATGASPSGAIVENVRDGSPAADAGLQAGDRIVSFDGERVRSAAQLARLVSETPDGRSVDVAVERGGSAQTMKVVPRQSQPLAALRDFRMPDIAARTIRPDGDVRRIVPEILGGLPRVGLRVQEIGDQLRNYFGAPSGVLVTAVEDGTPAKTAGLRAGDVVTHVNGNAVTTTSELRRRLNDASGEATLSIVRDRAETEVKVTIPETRERTRRATGT